MLRKNKAAKQILTKKQEPQIIELFRRHCRRRSSKREGGGEMKITMLTLGSRGDVQPFVALGKELIKRNHEVTICTGASFKQFIEGNGIAFHPASADLMAIMESEEGSKVFNGGNFKLIEMFKFSKRVITPAYRKSMDDFHAASQGAALIIYHPKALGAVDIAVQQNISSLCLPPVPIMYPITEFPNFTISPNKNFGPLLNKWSYKVVMLSERPFIKQINDFREKTLKLPKRKAGRYTYEVDGSSIPILYPLSPFLFKEVDSWNQRVFLSGFFFMDLGRATLSEEIEEFLSAGKKPIVISFSSMPLTDPHDFQQKLIQAIKETENRAIVLIGTSGMVFDPDDQILAVDQAPHRLLFKRAAGIVHHGGVGTTAEALLSGVPQLILPFTADQPFWANRLYKKGYSVKPLREKNLKVSDLVLALEQLKNKERIERAEQIQKEIQLENGLQQAADYIQDILDDHKQE